jgi:hypothetical protein
VSPDRGKEVMKMQVSRNALQQHRHLPVFPTGESLKEWLNRKMTHEIAAEVSLALAAAVSLYYLALRIYQGVQTYAIYTY